jgi:putative aldouronate transport system substrate-binding protein
MKKKINLCFFIFPLFILSCNNENLIKINEVEQKEEITFSFYNADLTFNESFTDVIASEITKRTGVSLEFEKPRGDSVNSIDLMIASNNFPDLIFAKNDLSKLIEVNAVIRLDDYIEKYGKNMKSLYGNQIKKLKYSMEDPSIYSVGTFEIKDKILEVSGSLQMQNAILKEFGYPVIKTLEDYENAMKAYIRKYPEINGHKTLGLSLLTFEWLWYLSLSNTGNYVIGCQDDGQWIVDQDTLQAQYKFLNKDIFQFYKWLNHLYHEGLLDPESFTQSEDMWKMKMKGGYVLGTAYPLWGLKKIHSFLKTNGMDDRTYAYLPVTVSDKYLDTSMKDYGFSGGWGISISSSCKDKRKAFKFLDWMCSEEALILTNWGIKGIHYYLDEDGRRIAYKNLLETDGVGKWAYPFPQAGRGYIDSTGNPIEKDIKENIISEYSLADKDTLKAYGVEMWTDLFPTTEALGVSKHGQVWQYSLNSKLTKIVTDTDEYVKQCIIRMILDSEENFDSSWKNMQDKLERSDIRIVENELTNLIKMKMTLWEQN